jgi:hypothetical protein
MRCWILTASGTASRSTGFAYAGDMTLTDELERLAAFDSAARPETVRLSDELVTKAQTGARVSFIEDVALLEPYGGVAATLRFRI